MILPALEETTRSQGRNRDLHVLVTRKGSRRPEAIHRDGPNVIGHQIARRPASESQNNKRGKRPIDSSIFGKGASAGV